jgi:diguanylate cyclase (GGDEF)-like protein
MIPELLNNELVYQELQPDVLETASRRVLVAEDDALYSRLLQRFLTEQGYEVQLVANGASAFEIAISPNAPRLLLLDWVMPGMHGPDLCARLRQIRANQYQYILLLSSNSQKADIIAGLDAGADDYLTKPFHAHELLARIRVGERILRLNDRIYAAQKRLRFQATHDSLTGIWNRRALLRLLHSELKRADRDGKSLGLLMLDLDHFKTINDTFGHPAGDRVLREVAHRLNQSARSYDVIGRYGGEEFVVGTTGLDRLQLSEYADRMRNAIAATAFDDMDSPIRLTASIGICYAHSSAGWNVSKLIQCADAALYGAKNKGRNCSEILEFPLAQIKKT